MHLTSSRTEFQAQVPTLLKDFETGEKEVDPAKLRSTLRFLAELYVIGVLHTLEPIMSLLKKLIADDEKTREFANLKPEANAEPIAASCHEVAN